MEQEARNRVPLRKACVLDEVRQYPDAIKQSDQVGCLHGVDELQGVSRYSEFGQSVDNSGARSCIEGRLEVHEHRIDWRTIGPKVPLYVCHEGRDGGSGRSPRKETMLFRWKESTVIKKPQETPRKQRR
jgi:hypothetical protein